MYILFDDYRIIKLYLFGDGFRIIENCGVIFYIVFIDFFLFRVGLIVSEVKL